MIDPKYSLKYSFPHSVVHIVDNSMYTGETVVQQVQDPSLFSTIVVTGLPMGEDNRFINVTRSDVLNTGFGINTLTTSDINKYSQAVEYPMALLQQNVPVKLLRITPDDATYGLAVLMVQWKKENEIQNNKFEVRFKVLSEDSIKSVITDLSEYRNVSRLNKALVSRLNNHEDESIYEYRPLVSKPADWEVNYNKSYYEYVNGRYQSIPEGEGAPDFVAGKYYYKIQVWNQRVFMTIISAGRGGAYNRMRFFINKVAQTRRQTAVTYNFGTIDTLNGLTVENFTAALTNHSTYALRDYVDNNFATEIDTVNIAVAKRLEGSSVLVPTVNESAVEEVFNDYMAYFKTRKESGDTEYANYGRAYDEIYKTLNSSKFDMLYGMFTYKESTFKLPYYQVDMYDVNIPKLPESQLAMIDEDSFVDNYGATKSGGVINGNVDIAAPNVVFDTYIRQAVSRTFDNNNSPAPGDLYLTGVNNKNPYFVMVVSVNLKNGSVSTLPFTKVYTLDGANINKEAPSVQIARAISGVNIVTSDSSASQINDFIRTLNTNGGTFVENDVIAVTGVYNGSEKSERQFHLYKITGVTEGKISTIVPYPFNLYAAIDYTSNYLGEGVYDQICLKSRCTFTSQTDVTTVSYPTDGSFSRLGSLFINDYGTDSYINRNHTTVVAPSPEWSEDISSNCIMPRYLAYFDKDNNPVFYEVSAYSSNPANTGGGYWGHTTLFRAFTAVPSGISVDVNTDIVGEQFDVLVFDNTVTVYQSEYFAAGSAKPAGWPAGYYKDAEGTEACVDGDWTPTEQKDFEAGADKPSGWPTSYYKDAAATEACEDSDWDNSSTQTYYKLQDQTFYKETQVPDPNIDITITPADYIFRCNVQSAVNNTYRVTYAASIDVPANYYLESYGDILYSSAKLSTSEGGVPIVAGSTGFFDEDLSDIEFKWRYSALLVRAFRGEIDPRILSPVRVPAFYMFDAGFNTVVGMNVLPYTTPNIEDVIYASTVFTDEEKELVLYDKTALGNIKSYEDIDVKQAMYDLMIERVYQRIPEENRPVGPGSGLSLHLDSGITSAETAIAVNNSFKQRFDNPNASWDIGGYVDANNGVSYTYLMHIVKNCFTHYRNYTINKPFVRDYSAIGKDQYLSFFPDLDATDWEMRELYYNSGGNAWIMDVQGNLTRRSQRSLYREETGTSDLYQESNMRTLSQFVYLIQTEIDHYLLEYNDDGVIKTMQETVNNKFAGWAGNLVESYDITFRRDINTDKGEILICEVNVVFRGLILRVPIIVNVNRRNG